MNINSNNTDFFKPNRQVWQEAEPGSSNIDVDTDADKDVDIDTDTEEVQNNDLDDFMQVMRIIENAKNECETTKKAICSLRKDEVWNLKEVNRFRKFIDELDYKFFITGEGAKKLKYTTNRFRRLEEQLDMEKITQEFLKAKSYEIMTYFDRQTERSDKLKDRIVFEYKDGSKKAINLEMILNPPPLISNYSDKEKEHEVEEPESIGDRISEYLPFSYNFSEWDPKGYRTTKMQQSFYEKSQGNDKSYKETEEEREKIREEFEVASEEYERRKNMRNEGELDEES